MKTTPRHYAVKLISACLRDKKNIKQMVDDFWHQVLVNKHFSWRKRIVQEVDNAWRELTGHDQVKIWSARHLSSDEKKQLIKTLHKLLNNQVEFEWGVKPHIMGGLVMVMNDVKFDWSIKGRLDALYYNLIK